MFYPKHCLFNGRIGPVLLFPSQESCNFEKANQKAKKETEISTLAFEVLDLMLPPYNHVLLISIPTVFNGVLCFPGN